MTEQIKRINNPLTIIAIFAALAEVNATIAISLIDKSLHYIFIWFIIGFPTLLVILFFVTLNYNTGVMYSPSDYREDKTFLDSLYGQVKGKSVTETESNTIRVLEAFEGKILGLIDEKISSKAEANLSKEELLSILQADVKELSEKTIQESRLSFTIPEKLRSQIIRFISYPAFLPIIYAIVANDATSQSDLKKIESKYGLPRQWDTRGLKGLIGRVLEGDASSFKIADDLKDPLKKWIEVNESVINGIAELYKIDFKSENHDQSTNEKARILAQNLVY